MYIAPIAFKLLFDAPATFQRHLYFKKGIKPVFERIKKCMPIIKIIFQEAGMDYLSAFEFSFVSLMDTQTCIYPE